MLLGVSFAVPCLAASRVVPNRIVVRLAPSAIGDCAHCRFEAGEELGHGLDALNAQFGVTSFRPMFEAYHAADVDARRDRFFAAIERAHEKNPKRAKRAILGETTNRLIDRMLNTYVVEMPTDRPGDIAEAYAEVDAVEMAIPDRQATMIAFEPNDPFWASENSWEQGYADLWGMKMIGAYDAWQAVRGSGVRIAVIDDSIERFHVDIQPNLCINEDDPPD
jgi:hypothetical protein